MATFLYYLPERTTGLALADLASRGLGHAFESGRELSKREVTAGPDGKAGGLVAHCPAGSLLYLPDRQHWRRVPDSEAWVGHATDAPPSPDDLIRIEEIDGHRVRLGDGHHWLVPAARRLIDAGADQPPEHAIGVPRAIDWDDEGRRVYGDVVPRYRALWAATCGWFDAKIAADTDAVRAELLEQSVAEEYALAGLAANYRLGKAESGLLRLLTETNEVEILDAMIDWPAWVRWLKKKQATDGLNIEHGPPVDSPGTDLP